MDPRQAIDEWLEFAQKIGYSRVTGQRRYRLHLERVETIIEEEKSLFEFCRHKGLNRSEELGRFVHGPPTKQGHEHKVFLPLEGAPPRVTKVTFPDKYGRREHTPFLYMERLALCNYLFPELEIRLEDFTQADADKYSFVVSMRAFVGPHPTLVEIDRFLRNRGFEKLESLLTIDYTNKEARIHLRDCHARNWVKSANDVLIPIDVTPERVI